MHPAALAYVAAHVPRTATSVLEFGSRNINGSPRTVVPPGCRYVGVDIVKGFDVDIVADAATVMLPEMFDVVVCAEGFEHADDATCAAICRNALDHLVPGGRFLVTMAGLGRGPHSAVDGGPVRAGEFYRNVNATLLEDWLTSAGFGTIEINELGDDLRGKATK